MKQTPTGAEKPGKPHRRHMFSPEKPTLLLILAMAAGLSPGWLWDDGRPVLATAAARARHLRRRRGRKHASRQPAGQPAMPYNGMATLPPVNDDPQQLMGLDYDELNGILGKPALVRRDGDAEVWQYRADRCVLDLFLYGVDKKVEHVDLRDRGHGDGDSLRDCFAGMLRAAMPST